MAMCKALTASVVKGLILYGWHGFAICRAMDLRFTDRGFESWLGTIA